MSSILLIGLGDLGSLVLELLAREPHVERIVVGSRDRERAIARCNLARLGALAQGYEPSIEFSEIDLAELDWTCKTIERFAPDLILSTASMLTWWIPDLLPAQQAARLKRAKFGVWLPVHLAPTLRLMEAVREVGYRGHTLIAPYPDVVNCILGRLGLAPTCGVGNIDEIVPKLRLLAAERLGVVPRAVDVTLVAHHALERFAFSGADADTPPYFLRIEQEGFDVTRDVRAEQLLLTPYPLPPGRTTHFLTAGSVVRLVKALLSDEETFLHAPGPCGWPGGYPVIAGRAGVRPAPIPSLSPQEAIAINERSHWFDGIERIEEDGGVVFDPEAAAVLHETLGYLGRRLAPDEAADRAHELVARMVEYASKHGVRIEQRAARGPHP
ncbi:MAG: hypothetical protein JSU87_12880 [Gemmatimonadota bacterium]|nr:MAG: hypothetical protein JSU87_12880 [Gemmatimonadota bacterium]